ncbi:MAG: hypothetical protein WAU78_02140 [Roseiarcus sp.]
MAVAAQKRNACAATIALATFSFRKNRIRGSLQSKVGEGFRVGRSGRSLCDRPALAGRGLASRRIRTRRLQEGQNRWSRRQRVDFVGNRQGKSLEILGKSLEKFGISLEKLGFSLERLGEIWPRRPGRGYPFLPAILAICRIIASVPSRRKAKSSKSPATTMRMSGLTRTSALAPIVGLAASKRTLRAARTRALEFSTAPVLSPLFDTIRRYNCSWAVVRLRDVEERS